MYTSYGRDDGNETYTILPMFVLFYILKVFQILPRTLLCKPPPSLRHSLLSLVGKGHPTSLKMYPSPTTCKLQTSHQMREFLIWLKRCHIHCQMELAVVCLLSVSLHQMMLEIVPQFQSWRLSLSVSSENAALFTASQFNRLPYEKQ